jgi:hypothetical protein
MHMHKADIEPDQGLEEETLRRLQTIQEIFSKEKWLTGEMLNHLQAEPPSNHLLPASDWKQQGQIFSVTFEEKEYFPCYEFDTTYRPLPLIGDVLAAFGPVADTWKIAAWFHYPNGWIVESDDNGIRAIAPKDALDRRDDLMKALEKHEGTYVA